MARVVSNYGIPSWDEVSGTRSCKFAQVEFALRVTTPWIRDLITSMLLTLPHERVHTVVDIKFWPELKKGSAPARLGWHLDFVTSAEDPLPEEHHALYQVGAKCYTHFKDTVAFDGSIIRYNRELHTATRAGASGPRLLVRVSQNDKTAGVSRLITPTMLERT